MKERKNVKLKLLYLRRMLEEETDEEHGITMTEILERLEREHGIVTERKSIYRDFDTLRKSGDTIIMKHRAPAEYYLVGRRFSLHDLMLLCDAVRSSKVLTEGQGDRIIAKLKRLCGRQERKQLNRSIHVPDRVSSQKSAVFSAIDIIHEALREQKRLRFRYVHLDEAGKECPADGPRHRLVTPLKVSYTEGFYYLSAYEAASDTVKHYRIDRMRRPTLTGEAADTNEVIDAYRADDDPYVYFGQFGGERADLLLECTRAGVEIVRDRFLDAAEFISATEDAAFGGSTSVQAQVKVHVSPQFYGWLAGMAEEVRLVAPAEEVQKYRSYLAGLLEG